MYIICEYPKLFRTKQLVVNILRKITLKTKVYFLNVGIKIHRNETLRLPKLNSIGTIYKIIFFIFLLLATIKEHILR